MTYIHNGKPYTWKECHYIETVPEGPFNMKILSV